MARPRQLDTLLSLAERRPKTNIGLIRWAWPTIAQARRKGFTLRELRDAFAKDGVDIEYSTFRHLIAKVARERVNEPTAQTPSPAAPQTADNQESAVTARDHGPQSASAVVAGMIEQEQRRKRLEFEHQKLPNEEDLF